MKLNCDLCGKEEECSFYGEDGKLVKYPHTVKRNTLCSQCHKVCYYGYCRLNGMSPDKSYNSMLEFLGEVEKAEQDELFWTGVEWSEEEKNQMLRQINND